MNETMQALLTRRSVRRYRAEMPKKEDLEQIIQAGLYAASGKGGQSSIILAVTDKQLRDRLMEMNRKIGGWAEGFDPFYGAPAVLVVLATGPGRPLTPRRAGRSSAPAASRANTRAWATASWAIRTESCPSPRRGTKAGSSGRNEF